VLDALLAQVQVDNQTLRAAEARVRQAQALADAARAARSASVTVGGENDFGIVASWEPDLWGRIRRSIEAGSASAQASEADLAAARLSVQATLAQTYFLLRAQDDQNRLLTEAVAAAERSVQITRNQYAVGVAARADVVQAEAQLGSTRAQLLDGRLTRNQLENAIALLLGKAPADFRLDETTQEAAIPAVPPSLPSELLRRRPDIAAAERRVAAASAQIGVAKAAFYPSVNLSAGVTVGDGLIGAARVEWPVYDAGLRRAKSAQALAAYDEAVATYRQTVLAGFREVEDNLAALNTLEQAAAAQSAAVDAARASVRITDNQYRAGITNYLSVALVQTATLNTERVAVSLRARRQIAAATLIKALGGDWAAASDAAGR
jgi:NodT family efflux transporter outer membrane factor (OMF) lipoprotein